MEHGALYVLVLLSLLVFASERNKGDVTRCWAKGKEVTIHPHQCPAEFDGADAKFCCRLCYGANCCLPRKPRVKQDRCPQEAQLAGAIRNRRTAPDAKTTATPERQKEWFYFGTFFVLLVLAVIFISLSFCSQNFKRCWELCNQFCDREERIQARVNVQSSRVSRHDLLGSDSNPDFLCPPSALHVEAPPHYSLVDLPPPYPGQPVVNPQGIRDLPPPYPGGPVVAFRRSSSRVQDDKVVILPLSVVPEEAAASGGESGAAATGGAPEEADPLEAIAYGGVPAAYGGVPAAYGGVPEPPE